MTLTSKLSTLVLASLATALLATTAMADRQGDREGRQGGNPMMQMDFAAADADGDGKITPAEIDAYRIARLTAADTDKDGFLSAEEVSAMAAARMAARANTRAAEMATRMIERQDTDGDGKLSLAEMAQPTGPERMIARLDTDKDGALSAAELAAGQDRMAERQGGKRGGKHDGKHGAHRSKGGTSDQGN